MRQNLTFGKRIVSFILLFTMVVTSFATSVTSAFAADGVNFEVTVGFKPASGQESVEIGGTGTYNLSATTASSELTDDYLVTVMLPRGAEKYLKGFSEKEVVEGGNLCHSLSSSRLNLFIPSDESQNPYFYFTMTKGDTYSVQVNFSMPEGTSDEYTIHMDESYINAVYIDSESGNTYPVTGNVLKDIGDMSFFTHYDWNDVKMSRTPDSVTFSAY